MFEVFQKLLNPLTQEALLLALFLALGIELACLVKLGSRNPTEIVKFPGMRYRPRVRIHVACPATSAARSLRPH